MKTPEVVNDFVLAVLCSELRTFRGEPLNAETTRQMMECIISSTGVMPDGDPTDVSPSAVGWSLRQALGNVNELRGLIAEEKSEQTDAT